MKLSDFLSESNKSAADFAREIGVTVNAVNFWCNGERTPRPAQMQKIFEVTSGVVAPNDFYTTEETGASP
jgi:transcriptional regulator with XRE-family HTH domain